MRQGTHGGNVFEAARHLGCSVEDIHDYSSNVSPYPIKLDISPDALSRLPEPHSETLAKKFAEKYGYKPENIAVTSGTTEAIDIICRLYQGRKVGIKNPTYSDYGFYAKLNNLEISEDVGRGLYFICNPNNPTGEICPREHLPKFFRDNPETLFVVDESYMPFVLDEEKSTLIDEEIDNLIILRSFSKIYGLPGLRLGAVIGSADNIEAVNSLKSPWSVNSYAQEAGLKLLNVDTKAIALRLHEKKCEFLDAVSGINWLEVQNSEVNYMLIKLNKGTSADLFNHCLEKRVLIRDCDNFKGLEGEYIRIAVTDDMNPLINALKEF